MKYKGEAFCVQQAGSVRSVDEGTCGSDDGFGS
jgi:hypothetical protein